jgi:ribonuclease Y
VDALHEAERLVADSAREIETVRSAALVEGKMASLQLREEVEKEAVKRREELDRLEKRALDREQSLDRRTQDIKEQESRVAARDGELKKKIQELEVRQQTLEKLEGEERRKLGRRCPSGADAEGGG